MTHEHETSQPLTVSRRRLLQVLAVSGTAVTLEMLLPQSWMRPSAAASPAAPQANPLIGDLYFFWQPYNSNYDQGTVRFRYSDDQGEINSSSPLYAFDAYGTISNGMTAVDINGMFIPYTPNLGTMRFPLPHPTPIGANQGVKLYIVDPSNESRLSNTIGNSVPVDGVGSLNLSNPAIFSEILPNGACYPVAAFTYNGSLANMVTNATGLYAWRNSSGWISAGGSLANMSGMIMPRNDTSGEVYFPIATINSSEPFELSMFLEDTTYHYDTEVMTGVYEGCPDVRITSLSNKLCGPAVQDGQIGCRYDLMIGYYDEASAMGEDARLSVRYEGNTLLDRETLADLGVSVPDPQSGLLFLSLLLPQKESNGVAHPLQVVLENEDGEMSDPAETPVEQFCLHEFSLVLNTMSALPINGSTTKWRVHGTYNDSAGLVGNSSLLTAVLNSATSGLRTLYNRVPLASVGGAWQNSTYSYFLPAFNCTAQAINGSIGDILFDVNTNGDAARSAALDEAELSWFLTEPAGRDASATSVLIDIEDEPPLNFMPIVRG